MITKKDKVMRVRAKEEREQNTETDDGMKLSFSRRTIVAQFQEIKK